MVIAPDGICGNLIFRTLALLCGARSLGAPVLMEKIFVDSSRARGNFQVDIEWKDGKVTSYRVASPERRKVKVRIGGETRTVRAEKL